MVLVGLGLFLIGALVAALANDFATLLVGRSFQGIGGGGLIALTEILVTDLVPLRLRGQWFGFISAMWSIGSVSGPIIGGAFAQNVTWVSHWTFTSCSSNTLTIVTALDLLSQSAFHRSCSCCSAVDAEAGLQGKQVFREAEKSRLDWFGALHRFHDELLDSNHLGMC